MARDHGYSTKKRTYILNYFAEHPDREIGVNELHSYLLENEQEANVTTIYRYLDRLVDQGIVFKTVHGSKTQATYHYMDGKEECCRHLHLKCKVCGKIQHLDCGFMEEIVEHISGDHGFDIDCRDSYLAGICRECRGTRV